MKTAGRLGLMAALFLAVALPNRLAAQDSQFGIRGLGTPGKWESVRARSAGGAFAPFDPFSPLMDAALADVRRTTASVTSGTSWRSFDAAGTQTTLRGTRFPAMTLGGPLLGKVVIAGGFTTYLDRTFGIVTHDTIDLRGTPQAITDEVTSDGAVTDLRLAAAIRPRRWIALGGGVHMLTGSSRIIATRTFADSVNFRTSSSRDEIAYGGKGVSLSALFDVTTDVRLATWWRSDSRLRADLRGRTVAENDLPVSYGGGIMWRAGTEAIFAGSAAWHSWSTAATGDSIGGPSAHDTFNWSAGAELGPATSPIRLGARGGQLPFGIGKAPTEVGYSAGLGRSFSQGRGRLDVGIERLQRKGAGLTERVWTLLLGLTVRP